MPDKDAEKKDENKKEEPEIIVVKNEADLEKAIETIWGGQHER